MKNYQLLSSLLLFCFTVTILSLQSCAAKKEAVQTEHVMTIELKDKFDESYLLETYSEITSAKRSNKTLNQYFCKATATVAEHENLMGKLQLDQNIIKVNKASVAPGKGTQSTNVGRSKTKPIKQ